MILQNKNAIIYGAGGSLGSAVAKGLAESGAKVFLTGRNLASVQKIADEILAFGGLAESAEVDALDGSAINQHMDDVLNKAGTVDVSFNAIGVYQVQNIPLVEMSMADFVNPVATTLHTQFLTATAAAKVMIKQKSGVILTLTATPGGIGYPFTGSFSPSCAALENFSVNLASEIGINKVRVVNIRSGGSPDSKIFKDAIESNPAEMESVLLTMKNDTMLKELPLMADIANLAVFLASDLAGKITGITIDVTCGTTTALNYRSAR